jgi:diguanylate cyclase (GGDEF)-like protein/PAS domain S-box-containing protein
MARLTPEGVLIDANTSFARLLGKPAAKLRGKRLLDLLHPDDATALRAGRLSKLHAGKILAELRFEALGRTVWGRASLVLARQSGDSPDALVLTVEDLTEQKAREARLEQQRSNDPATGLPSGTEFTRRLSKALSTARRRKHKLAVMVLELEGLTSTGDEAENDQRLGDLARRLQEQVRPADCVARTGGNEFAFFLHEVSEADLAAGVGRRLLARLEAEPKTPVSLGVAIFPDHAQDARSLLRMARLDLYLGDRSLPAADAAATGVSSTAPPAPASSEEVEADLEKGDHLARRVELLEPVALFLSVPQQVLRRIARYLSEQTAGPGEVLGGAGSPAAIRIIQEGICEVRTETPTESLSLLTLGPGDFMGVDSLLLDDPVPTEVRALTDCKLLVLEEDAVTRTAPAGSAFREALRLAAGQRDTHLRSLLARPHRTASGSTATQLAVYSTKGGSGRTTLALNLAAELGRRHPGEVLVIDLSLPYNHVALLANLSPSTCLARVAQATDERSFRQLLLGAVLPHPAGFMALPAALRPEEAELVKPALLTRALSVLSAQYRYVVFDLGIALDDCVLAALELSDHLLLVTTPELAAMHDSRQVIDLATRVLNIPAGRIHTLLNHRAADSAMNRKVVEEVLGRTVAAEFRYFGAKPELASLEGKLQSQSDPGGAYSRSVRALVDQVIEPAVAPPASAR